MPLRKKLSLLLVLVLVLSLFSGLQVCAAPDDTVYLAFTSDVHYDTAYEQNNLELWLDNLQNTVETVDYLGICGDLGSAYASTPELYWDYVQEVMNTVDRYVAAGLIANGAIYTLGNHEWYPSAGGDFANYQEHPTVQKLNHNGVAAATDKYIIYCFNAASTSRDFAQDFLEEDIAELAAFLQDAPTDIPIIIMTHFPLHSFSSRTSTNADLLVELLNNYPNVILLWGHNHSVYDTHYDRVFIAGDWLEVSDDMKMDIYFTYAAAGCMADSEYNLQSASIKGKGLLLAITGSKVSFTYYDREGNPLVYTTEVDVTDTEMAGLESPFTVKFKDGYDGTILAVQKIKQGDSATAPEVREYEGYIFAGWNREFDRITKNITVTALYEAEPEEEEPLAKEAELDQNYVYISLTAEGKPASGKSGKPIILYPVPWTEGMTVKDAVTKLHELEYKDGQEGVAADNPYGFYLFTKIWGYEPAFNTLAFDKNNYVDAAQVTAGGDIYYLHAYAGDWLPTSFITPAKIKTVTGKPITLRAQTMNMNPDYSYTPLGFTADIYLGTDLDNLANTGVKADERGYFTISFDRPGTYYVVAKSPAGNYADGAAIVEVRENSGQYVYINLTVDGEVMTDKDGNFIAYYPMVLEPGDTIDDIMTELHAHAFGRGSAWKTYDSGGFAFVAGVWGLYNENNCGNIYLNNSAAPVSGTTVLQDGDVLDINGYSDFTTYAHYRAAMFDKKYAEIEVGEEITLTAWRAGLNLETFTYDTKPNQFTPIYIDFKPTDYLTDEQGRVTISFAQAGTYIVTGGTTPSSTSPVCVIKVGSDNGRLKTEPDVTFLKQTLTVNGKEITFAVYNIDGDIYLKLRDLAMALNDTGAQFAVTFAETAQTILCTTGEPYTALGGELTTEDGLKNVKPSPHKLVVDDKTLEIPAYIIGGNNFFRPNDLAEFLGFEYTFDAATGTGSINSKH